MTGITGPPSMAVNGLAARAKPARAYPVRNGALNPRDLQRIATNKPEASSDTPPNDKRPPARAALC